MKLTVQVKLLPDKDQSTSLKESLERVNAACNRMSQLAWEIKEFKRFNLSNAFYHQIRREFSLSSQAVVLLTGKVANAYKVKKGNQRFFKNHGSIIYDEKNFRLLLDKSIASIWTVNGRIRIPYVCSDNTRKLLELPKGETDLILRDGKWFLNVSVEVPEHIEYKAMGWLGIDLGVVEIAATSDGEKFSGSHLNSLRARHHALRKKLQSKGTRSAKRLLKKRRLKEAGFSRHTNHVISKKIVSSAKRTARGIAMEDLKHIRERIKAGRKQRKILHSWAFGDLQSKIAYKAKLTGVPVKFIDPRNSSRECPKCGHISKKNRKKRDSFVCESCGHSGHSDINGAINLRNRASSPGDISHPNESTGQRVKALHGGQV